MASSIALLCFLLILNQSSSLVHASVEETCRTIAASGPDVNYDFCVASLSADPESSSADTKGLAVIATNLANANATSTKSTISNMLKNTSGPATKQCLNICLTTYTNIVNGLGDTVGEIKSGRYLDAQTNLSAIRDGTSNCEYLFVGKSIKSPLTKENLDSRDLSSIALEITNLLG